MQVDGSCHCGAVSYRAEIDPEAVVVCHCTDCQALSGSAYRVIATSLPDAFELSAAEPRIYVKTADSGRKRAQAFCELCGSHIYATSVDAGPKVYAIRVGTIRQRAELLPRIQFWRRSAQAWAFDLADVPSIDGNPKPRS